MKLLTSFTAVSDTEIISASGSIVSTLAEDRSIFQSLISLLPTQEGIQEAHERYQVSYNAALTGDPVKGLARDADRKELNRRLAQFAALVKLVAEEDPSLAARLGLALQREKKVTTSAPLTAPTKFKVWHGEEHGVVYGKTSSVKRAKSMEMQVCEGDPTVESNWRYAGVYVHCTKMEIKGLTPGRVYSYRGRGIGTNGPGPWSSYITLMAI